MYELTITNAPHGVTTKIVDGYEIRGDMVLLYKDDGESDAGGVIQMGKRKLTDVLKFNVLHIKDA